MMSQKQTQEEVDLLPPNAKAKGKVKGVDPKVLIKRTVSPKEASHLQEQKMLLCADISSKESARKKRDVTTTILPSVDLTNWDNAAMDQNVVIITLNLQQQQQQQPHLMRNLAT